MLSAPLIGLRIIIARGVFYFSLANSHSRPNASDASRNVRLNVHAFVVENRNFNNEITFPLIPRI